ncbi:hypothetical protein HZA40_01790 [Candidatus Peregrinibacteria bacterium]|nr:hypothetical protein [Candidatus Peregrinibacteria bacterium]
MADGNERFGYDDASRAEREIGLKLGDHGLDKANIKQMVILGSGLGDFAKDYLDTEKACKPSGPIKVPFSYVYDKLNGGGIDRLGEAVPGHERALIIGPLKGSTDGSLVMAQAGREHPYEGVSTRRATFWLRVAQLMGVKDLIGSNAAGILTPQTLEEYSIMLVHSDRDYGNDNPLIGQNDERFGPRFPHRADSYPVEIREIVKRLAGEMGIDLKEGTYFRLLGPNYESTEDVYDLRGDLRRRWEEGRAESDPRFMGEPVGVVGMSSTYENMVAQHASQADKAKGYPAFENRAYFSAVINYAALLGLSGLITNRVLDHAHVEDAAKKVTENMSRLVQGTLLKLRKRAD